MSEYEEEDIQKMFSEIMSNNSIGPKEETKEPEDALGVQNLLVIQESLMDTMLSINSIIYRIYSNEQTETIPEGLAELLAALYSSSEKFFSYMSKNDGIIDMIAYIESEDENEQDEDEDDEDEDF